jgi:hypothetical protein
MNEDDLRLISGQRFQPPEHGGLARIATCHGSAAERAYLSRQSVNDSCKEWLVSRPDYGLDGGAEG